MKTQPKLRAGTCVRKSDGETVLIGPISESDFEDLKSDEKYEGFIEATWVPEGECLILNTSGELHTVKWYSSGKRETLNKQGEVVYTEIDPDWEAFRLNFKDSGIKSRYTFGPGRLLPQ